MSRTHRKINFEYFFRRPKTQNQRINQSKVICELNELGFTVRNRYRKYIVSAWDDINIAALSEVHSSKL